MAKTMASMELDDDDKLDFPKVADKAPDYPYGLRICLTETELDKLGLDPADAEYGGVFMGHFMARVTHVSHGEGPDGKNCRIEAQIEHLAIEGSDDD
jgi:hypothetical protein